MLLFYRVSFNSEGAVSLQRGEFLWPALQPSAGTQTASSVQSKLDAMQPLSASRPQRFQTFFSAWLHLYQTIGTQRSLFHTHLPEALLTSCQMHVLREAGMLPLRATSTFSKIQHVTEQGFGQNFPKSHSS